MQICHNLGVTKSTKSGRPWQIVYYEEYESKSEAIKREYIAKEVKKIYRTIDISKKIIKRSCFQSGRSVVQPVL